MYHCMTWKQRPLSPERDNRMMEVWGKLEASLAENPNVERVCWFIYSDGSGGINITKSHDVEAGLAFELEVSLALAEFVEIESKVGIDLDTAMPTIVRAMERVNT